MAFLKSIGTLRLFAIDSSMDTPICIDYASNKISFIGDENALQVEFIGDMVSIESSITRHWSSFWPETDFMNVVETLSNFSIVPWHPRNRWDNCVHSTLSMNFMVSNIFREGEKVMISLQGWCYLEFSTWEKSQYN